MRALQEKVLLRIAEYCDEIHAHVFPNSFYASRILIWIWRIRKRPTTVVALDSYKGKTVVELTGNYFAAYMEDELDKNHPAAATCQDVVLPILQITVPVFPRHARGRRVRVGNLPSGTARK